MRKQRDNQACLAFSGTAGRNAAAALVSSSFTVVDDDIDADIVSGNNSYDARGRCVRHPRNRLRKKKMLGFGGWKVLMTACPDCCMEEIGVHRDGTENPGGKETRRDAEKSDVGSSGRGIRKGAVPRITAASTATAPSRSYHPQKASDDTVTTCGTGGSSGHSARFSRPHPEDDGQRQNVAGGTMQRSTSLDQNSLKRQQDARLEQLTAQYHQLRALNRRLRLDHPGEIPADSGPAFPLAPVRSVTGPCVAAESEREEGAFEVEHMEYTDARGFAGRYSGAVDRHLVPHGRGAMDYGNGLRVRGEWRNGWLGLSRRGESRLSSCTGRPGISV